VVLGDPLGCHWLSQMRRKLRSLGLSTDALGLALRAPMVESREGDGPTPESAWSLRHRSHWLPTRVPDRGEDARAEDGRGCEPCVAEHLVQLGSVNLC
jgi:hypothetical protein